MKPTELRIGNYVRAKSPERTKWEEPVKVTIDYLEMFCRKIPAVHFEPIPLTEDWIMKFGFKSGGQSQVIYSVFKISKADSDGYSLHIGNAFNTITKQDCKVHIRYVHQLQNLYFTLVGEELNIHENPQLIKK